MNFTRIAPSPVLEFQEFPKLGRLSRECIITEKIDGTNAQVFIRVLADDEVMPTETPIVAVVGKLLLYAGSRTRWITPQEDNHGFALWVREHAESLAKLGPGRHFGEWWGSGINRGYGLTKGEKRWSLFNVSRWCLPEETPQQIPSADPRVVKLQERLPAVPGIGLVPLLLRGPFSTEACDYALSELKFHGSQAARGFMKPEGIVCFHVAANVGFKKTIEKDDVPKSVAA